MSALIKYLDDSFDRVEILESPGSGPGADPRTILVQSATHKCAITIGLEPLRDYAWAQLRHRLDDQKLLEKVGGAREVKILSGGVVNVHDAS